jgi:hypothetical protein
VNSLPGKVASIFELTKQNKPMENYDILSRHYQLFCSHVTDFTPDNFKNARGKLVKLSKNQFLELSTDVYDDLMRRNEDQIPFLPIVDSYHQKRNQARQKLATLQYERFKELCFDVTYEIKRRYPDMKSNEPKQLDQTRQKDNHNHDQRQNINYNQDQSVPKSQPLQKNNYDGNAKPPQPRSQDRVNSINQYMPPSITGERKNSITVSERKSSISSNPPSGEDKYHTSRDYNQKEQERPNPKLDYNPPVFYEMQNASKDKDLQKEIQFLKQEAEKERLNFDRLYEKLSTKLAQCEQNENNLLSRLDEQQRISDDFRSEASNLLQEIKTVTHENINLRQGRDCDSSLLQEIKSLKHENNDLRQDRDGASNLLQDIKALQHENNDLRQDRDDYYSLLENLESKQALMEGEAQKDKDEIARLAYKNEKLNFECKELNDIIKKLTTENKELKKTAQEKNTALTEAHAIIGLRTAQPPIMVQNTSMTNGDSSREMIESTLKNIIDAVHTKHDISPYIKSISLLIKEAQDQKEPSPNVLIAMKSVVLSCKQITEDMEKNENTLNLSADEKNNTMMIKQKLSSSLSKLMQKAKSCASFVTDENIVNLESSAKELSQYIIELVTTLETYISHVSKEKAIDSPESYRSISSKSSIKELKVLKT